MRLGDSQTHLRFTSSYLLNRSGASKHFLCDDVGGKSNVFEMIYNLLKY